MSALETWPEIFQIRGSGDGLSLLPPPGLQLSRTLEAAGQLFSEKSIIMLGNIREKLGMGWEHHCPYLNQQNIGELFIVPTRKLGDTYYVWKQIAQASTGFFDVAFLCSFLSEISSFVVLTGNNIS